MNKHESKLQEKIRSGQQIVLAEFKPPKTSDPELVRKIAKQLLSHVDAIGISDNRNEICMSAVTAASIVLSEGVEPILHMTTRDRNRIALMSDCLGAHALGIRNLLCTSGEHQTLGTYKTAKNVYDVDPVQLLQLVSGIEPDTKFCLGGVANPYSEPVDLQMMVIDKKISAGAEFFITQPVINVDKFIGWLKKITDAEYDKKAVFIAGVEVGDDGPKKSIETIKQLSSLKGLRGFEISGNTESVIEVLRTLRK
jgi:methylenetetrahydrofolate reductase (NADPH)